MIPAGWPPTQTSLKLVTRGGGGGGGGRLRKEPKGRLRRRLQTEKILGIIGQANKNSDWLTFIIGPINFL